MEAWPDYNHHPLCRGLHWLQHCTAGVISNVFGTKKNHRSCWLNLDYQVVLINTGILNWFGGGYNTDQQQRAPMDPNTFHVSFQQLC